MIWKANIQLRDLEPDQRFEATCRRCGHTHYEHVEHLIAEPSNQFRYIDEIEREIVCHARGCRGSVRLYLVRDDSTSGFVGGMA